MGNWAELPGDLLISIAQHLRLMEDYAVFGAVSKSWRAAATKGNFKGIPLWQQIPSLMLAAGEDDDYREFYSLFEDRVVARMFLPETKGKRCMESGFGWLFTIGQQGETSLVNPFTRDQIDLPHQNTTQNFFEDYDGRSEPQIFYRKAVLSSSPCQNPSDFVLMVIDGGCHYLSFWRPGDKLWTRISSRRQAFSDVVHHKGQVYAIDFYGRVVVCDLARKEIGMVARVPPDFPFAEEYYIVESLGKLLVVERMGVHLQSIEKRPHGYIVYDGDGATLLTYGTNQFRVLELDLINAEWKEIPDLGDRALFLGHSMSVCIEGVASRFPGIKPNHIYFTEDFYDSYVSAENGGGRDMGVYNLKDGSITPHFKGQSLSRISPPIWVMPCSSCMSNHKPSSA